MRRLALFFVLGLTTVVAASCSQGEQTGARTETGGVGGGGAVPNGGGGGSTAACPAGQQLCGADCVDVTTSLLHCGACNIPCSSGQTCTAGQCTCPVGTELCGTVCLSTASMAADPSNCGACGTVCPQGTACQAGQCACAAGRTDCSGTCVDLQSDANNCGNCAVACVAPEVCSAGACSAACGAGLTPCSGSCVNLLTDEANCNACGSACAGVQECVNGACTCPDGGTLCGSVCVDTSDDLNHCGGCGIGCVGGQSCEGGTCVCATGQEFCGSQCTDTATDGSNCGSCGNACGAGQTCEGGQCTGGVPTGGTGAGGGSSTGGTGAGGGTSSTGGSGNTGIDPAVFAPDLDGFYWEGTCDGAGSDNRQCAINNPDGSCNDNVIRDVTMSVNGDAGTTYLMEIEVRGLLGSRCYTGGVRRAGSTAVNWTGANDGLYIGGTVPPNWWNTYEVHVQGGPGESEGPYYLNCYYDNPSPTIEFDNQTCTMEEVLEVGYTFELPVMGNSTITFRLNDQNCQAQMNCGAYEGVKECPNPRTVDLSGMDPPATFDQPPINAIGGANYYPQWAYFDVKSVTEM